MEKVGLHRCHAWYVTLLCLIDWVQVVVPCLYRILVVQAASVILCTVDYILGGGSNGSAVSGEHAGISGFTDRVGRSRQPAGCGIGQNIPRAGTGYVEESPGRLEKSKL